MVCEGASLPDGMVQSNARLSRLNYEQVPSGTILTDTLTSVPSPPILARAASGSIFG